MNAVYVARRQFPRKRLCNDISERLKYYIRSRTRSRTRRLLCFHSAHSFIEIQCRLYAVLDSLSLAICDHCKTVRNSGYVSVRLELPRPTFSVIPALHGFIGGNVLSIVEYPAHLGVLVLWLLL